jgi:hypothetical protein
LSKPSDALSPPTQDKLAFDAPQRRDEFIDLPTVVLDSSQ